MKVRVYKDKAGEWRWSVDAANGNRLADSGEGYKNKEDAETALESVTHLGTLQMIKNDLQLLVIAIGKIEMGRHP